MLAGSLDPALTPWNTAVDLPLEAGEHEVVGCEVGGREAAEHEVVEHEVVEHEVERASVVGAGVAALRGEGVPEAVVQHIEHRPTGHEEEGSRADSVDRVGSLEVDVDGQVVGRHIRAVVLGPWVRSAKLPVQFPASMPCRHPLWASNLALGRAEQTRHWHFVICSSSPFSSSCPSSCLLIATCWLTLSASCAEAPPYKLLPAS